MAISTSGKLETKQLATLQARAALAGIVLNPIDDDAGRQVFILSRGELTKQLDSPDAVSVWLDRVNGKKTDVNQ